ncbi:DNA-binding protein HEXBP-like [Rhizophagus irregularis DAOM 181602=DAOM 197198]|nr:DNA-binding protein HEXBP-like [Rhizophagus irregularis DAOM 181602=DAOM 197198]
MIKIGKEIEELKDQYKNEVNVSQHKEKSIDQVICYRCNNRGHYSNRCKVEGRNTIKRKNNICENCGGKGHFIKECTSDKVEKDQIVCYRCNNIGYYASNCIKKRATQIDYGVSG